jgi:NTP pyrophosphatase (non-canonical NTP hydrolase)
MNVRDMQKDSFECAQAHGFLLEEPFTGADIDRHLLLTVGELCEAQNELRQGIPAQRIYFPGFIETIRQDEDSLFNELAAKGVKPEGVPIELADAVLRVYNLAAKLGIDIQQAMQLKHNYNLTRPFQHGGRRF